MKQETLPVIGQDNLISELDKIISIFEASEGTIKPHFILTGESGSGKTFTINSLAVKYKMNFIEINAAQLTKEGTSGNSLSKALTPLTNMTNKPIVCFVDEFDKLFISGNSNSDLAHETTNGVQNEFLHVLETEKASVYGDYGKYINVQCNNILFVFAGAFNGEDNISIDRLRELGVKTEFLGRVGLVFNTELLTLESLYQILEESTLLNRYIDLFENIDKEEVIYLIKAKLQSSYEYNTLGARLVNTLINQYFIKGNLNEESEKQVTFQSKLTL